MENTKKLNLIVHGGAYPNNQDLLFCINLLLNETITDEDKFLIKRVLYRYKIGKPERSIEAYEFLIEQNLLLTKMVESSTKRIEEKQKNDLYSFPYQLQLHSWWEIIKIKFSTLKHFR